ncbi:MAG: hypothetical protein ACRDSZ_11575 [Pseudonocardiaceae bacterium]
MTSGEVVEPAVGSTEPEPYRIGVMRRFRLWRLGRKDGRFGVPDPLSEKPPLTTRARDNLQLDFIDASYVLRVKYLTSTEGLRRSLRVLQDSELPVLQEAVASIAGELQRAQDNPPDRDAPLRRMGEVDQPLELIRDRRDREHQRAVARLRERREHADDEVTAARRRQVDLSVALASRWAQDEARLHRLHATFLRARAIYDHALLQRHPLPDLVRPELDMTVPPVPEWPSDSTDESGR